MEVTAWLVACVALSTARAAAADGPTVQLRLGELRGTRHRFDGRTYHAFRGVPYAEPPILFTVAVEKKPWRGTLDATEDGPSCLQHDAYEDGEFGGQYSGRHDCLFLNVYTPAVNNERGLAVIVYIHGGGYSSGHAGSEWVNPQYFMAKNVIVVTVAYRLGIFGFLCAGDEHAAANLGLRDQLLALRWVRLNVYAFGGAADRVTLMGHDAGAASVHLHMVAPSSRGLFSRAISQSGVWLSWWLGAQSARQAAATARALAGLAGCDLGTHAPPILHCLRSTPLRALYNATAQFQFWSIEPLSLFRPCVEAATDSAFLPDDPLRLLEEGQAASVPWLLGVTSGQAVFRLADLFSIKSTDARTELRNNFDEIMPVVLGLNVSFPSYKVKQAWMQIQLLYYGNFRAEPFKNKGRTLSDLYADRLFLHGWKKAIIYHNRFARADNIFVYVFNYTGSRTFQTYYGHGETKHDRVDWLSELGVCHGDDLLHLFEMPRLFPAASSSDKDVIRAMVALWTNFAKHGYPVANRERPAEEPPCWSLDQPLSGLALWPAASETQPWFVELRGHHRQDARLQVCPRLHLPATEARLRRWDQLPMAENLNLSLTYHKVDASRKEPPHCHDDSDYRDDDDDVDDDDDGSRQPCIAPRFVLRPLLCISHLLIVRHISL